MPAPSPIVLSARLTTAAMMLLGVLNLRRNPSDCAILFLLGFAGFLLTFLKRN